MKLFSKNKNTLLMSRSSNHIISSTENYYWENPRVYKGEYQPQPFRITEDQPFRVTEELAFHKKYHEEYMKRDKFEKMCDKVRKTLDELGASGAIA